MNIAYPDVKGVIFDAFGTIVTRGISTKPYVQFANAIKSKLTLQDSVTMMTKDTGLAGLAMDHFKVPVPANIAELERAVMAEVASMRAVDDIHNQMALMRKDGIKIGICSNLAAPYGVPLKALFEDHVDFMVLSYEVGMVKPDPRIYQLCADKMAEFCIQPNEILFVGDTDHCDYEGPLEAGMHARPVEFWRNYPSNPYRTKDQGPQPFASKVGLFTWFHKQHGSTQALARAKLHEQY